MSEALVSSFAYDNKTYQVAWYDIDDKAHIQYSITGERMIERTKHYFTK